MRMTFSHSHAVAMVLAGWRLVGRILGPLVRPVAGAVHDDLAAGVDRLVQEGLGDDEVGEKGIPVAGRPVAGDDQGPALPFGFKKFPGIAAHIDMIWRKTNVDWGNRNGGKPLTFLDEKLSADGAS
ncbi:hypothetical protein ACFQLX_05440 [Streptomyces polyrhachis]|uniref:Uncharacterized protein n=1 Tax=Streptomyces polyrhachis TaxID=1282885 RepID=A0ABW2GF20_9ACTN